MMAGYEVDLRRLFRPPLDHLPPSEQLQYYQQRDLRPSHIYRLGTGIFGTEPPRKRIINAALYSPPSRTPHTSLLRKSLDGRPLEGKKKVRFSDLAATEEPLPQAAIAPVCAATGARDFSEQEYKSWVATRRHMRSDLEALGANERWLCSKERTPLENGLLARLREKKREKMAAACATPSSQDEDSTNSSTPDAPSPSETRRKQLRHRKQMLKELFLLEKFLTSHRQRLVTLLMMADRNRDRHVTVEDLLTILNKLKAPIGQDAFELLLQAMGIPLTENGRVDYRVVLNGGLVKLAEEYLQREHIKNTTTITSEAGDSSQTSGSKMQGKEGALQDAAATLSQRYSGVSTMGGENGRLVDGYKQEGLRQFNSLVEYCKANGIVLDRELAERALLLPPDRPKAECEAHLRQPGLDLLSIHFADSPEEDEEGAKQRNPREEFGGAYMELRGRRKARFTRLSTGAAMVKTKTDCWLTYKDFMKLTETIQSKPGFKYQYHGLPDNHAFWPGALLDKLRLWQPSETLLDKPYSLYNIFQPVEHPKIYNAYSPLVVQRKSWPQNSRGYVQFGSQSRKSYAL